MFLEPADGAANVLQPLHGGAHLGRVEVVPECDPAQRVRHLAGVPALQPGQHSQQHQQGGHGGTSGAGPVFWGS